MRTSFRRLASAGAVATALVLVGSAPAGAHVTVSSPDAAPGGFGKLVFRVPSESDTARTTSVRITLPTETPFRFVSTKAMPGWAVRTSTTKLDQPVESGGFEITEAVSTVTWTARPGSALRPHEFTEFELSVGAFPDDVDQLVFVADQTYSDGEVVSWAELPAEGEEPEHPAPVLELDSTADETEQVSAESVTDASDPMARTLGIAGVVLGGAALGWAIVGRRRRS